MATRGHRCQRTRTIKVLLNEKITPKLIYKKIFFALNKKYDAITTPPKPRIPTEILSAFGSCDLPPAKKKARKETKKINKPIITTFFLFKVLHHESSQETASLFRLRINGTCNPEADSVEAGNMQVSKSKNITYTYRYYCSYIASSDNNRWLLHPTQFRDKMQLQLHLQPQLRSRIPPDTQDNPGPKRYRYPCKQSRQKRHLFQRH